MIILSELEVLTYGVSFILKVSDLLKIITFRKLLESFQSGTHPRILNLITSSCLHPYIVFSFVTLSLSLFLSLQLGSTQPARTASRPWSPPPGAPSCAWRSRPSPSSPATTRRASPCPCTTSRSSPSTSPPTSCSVNVRKALSAL